MSQVERKLIHIIGWLQYHWVYSVVKTGCGAFVAYGIAKMVYDFESTEHGDYKY